MIPWELFSQLWTDFGRKEEVLKEFCVISVILQKHIFRIFFIPNNRLLTKDRVAQEPNRNWKPEPFLRGIGTVGTVLGLGTETGTVPLC